MLSPKQGLLHRYSPGPAATPIHLKDVFPELRQPGAHVFPGFAVDSSGRVVVPALWRGLDRSTVPAVLVLNPDGTRRRAVVLSPPVEIRRVAAGQDGMFYVLGLDAAYFRSSEAGCRLVHKYSPDGKRLASFSSCPRTAGPASSSATIRRLNQEVELGHLWTGNGSVYHALPFSRELRVFTAGGRLVRRMRLEPPERNSLPSRYALAGEGSAGEYVWRIVPLAGGNFVVQWVHSQPQGAGWRNLPYLALHDARGLALSRPRPLPWKRSGLAFSDGDGFCWFLRWVSPERSELIRTKVSLD